VLAARTAIKKDKIIIKADRRLKNDISNLFAYICLHLKKLAMNSFKVNYNKILV
jgi:hypothetical protein